MHHRSPLLIGPLSISVLIASLLSGPAAADISPSGVVMAGLRGGVTAVDSQGRVFQTNPDGSRSLVATQTDGAAIAVNAATLGDPNQNKIAERLEPTAHTSAGDAVRVIVRGTGKVSPAAFTAAIRGLGGVDVRRSYSVLPAAALKTTRGRLFDIAKLPFVQRIDADVKVSIPQPGAQSERITRQFAPVTAADAIPGIAQWRKELTGAGIDVAVIDTGIDGRHANLRGRVVYGATFVEQECSTPTIPSGTAVDVMGHGTHVAGIIAGVGASGGVAPGARVVDVRVFNCTGSGYMSDVDKGLEWLIANHDKNGLNIKVANLSLGSAGDTFGTDLTSQLVNRLTAEGVAVFVAAGNNGLEGLGTITNPGAAKYAITVGAIAGMAAGGINMAFFSGRGPVRSGVNKPDIVAPGVDIISAQAVTDDFTADRAVSGTRVLSGTSMASPWAAGLAALALQASPETLTPSGTACAQDDPCADGVASVTNPLADRLRDTATDRGATGWDPSFGYGLIEPDRVLNPNGISRYPTSTAVSTTFAPGATAQTVAVDHSGGTLAWSMELALREIAWDSVALSRTVRVKSMVLRNSAGDEVPIDVGRHYFTNPDGSVWMSRPSDPTMSLQYTTASAVPAGRYYLYIGVSGTEEPVIVDISGASAAANVSRLITISADNQVVRPGQQATVTATIDQAVGTDPITLALVSPTDEITFSEPSLTIEPGKQASTELIVNAGSLRSGARIYARVTSANGLQGFRTIPLMIAINIGLATPTTLIDGPALRTDVAGTGEAYNTFHAGTRVLPTKNGNEIIFVSDQALLPELTRARIIYVKDRVTGALSVLSPELASAPDTYLYDATPDGRYVLISSQLALVETDVNGRHDLYRYDRVDQTFALVSFSEEVSGERVQGFGEMWAASISDNGSRVAFKASVDAVGGMPAPEKVFLWSINGEGQSNVRVLRTAVGSEKSSVLGGLYSTTFDASGRFLVFSQWEMIGDRIPQNCGYFAMGYIGQGAEVWSLKVFLVDLGSTGTDTTVTTTTNGDNRCADWMLTTAFDSAGGLYYFEYSTEANWSLKDPSLRPTSLGAAVPPPPGIFLEVIDVDLASQTALANAYVPFTGGMGTLSVVGLETPTHLPLLSELGEPITPVQLPATTGSGTKVIGALTLQDLLDYDDNAARDPYLIRSDERPYIASLSRSSGPVGTTVTISGLKFTGTTAVTLGTTAIASFEVLSPSRLRFTIPRGAVSGFVTISTAGGTARSTSQFTVTVPPPPPPAPPPPPPPAEPVPTPTPTLKANEDLRVDVEPDKPVAVTAKIESTTGGVLLKVDLAAGVLPEKSALNIRADLSAEQLAAGVVVIRLEVKDAQGAPVTSFAKAMSINIGKVAAGVTPAYSSDGATWTLIPQLSGTTLPEGQKDGYFINEVGETVILTTHLTYFGVKKQQAPLVVTVPWTQLNPGGRLTHAVSGGSGTGEVRWSTTDATICTITAAGEVLAAAVGTCGIVVVKASDPIYTDATSAMQVAIVAPVVAPAIPMKLTISGTGLARTLKIFDAASAGMSVRLQVRKPGTTKFVTVRTVRLDGTGRAKVLVRLATDSSVRAMVNGKSAAAIRVR